MCCKSSGDEGPTNVLGGALLNVACSTIPERQVHLNHSVRQIDSQNSEWNMSKLCIWYLVARHLCIKSDCWLHAATRWESKVISWN